MNAKELYLRKLIREKIYRELKNKNLNESIWGNIVSRVKAINQAGKDVEEKGAFDNLNKNVRKEMKDALTNIGKKYGSYLNKYQDALQSGRKDLEKEKTEKINVNEVLYEIMLGSVIDIISKDYGSPNVIDKLIGKSSSGSNSNSGKDSKSSSSESSSERPPNKEAGTNFGQKKKETTVSDEKNKSKKDKTEKINSVEKNKKSMPKVASKENYKFKMFTGDGKTFQYLESPNPSPTYMIQNPSTKEAFLYIDEKIPVVANIKNAFDGITDAGVTYKTITPAKLQSYIEKDKNKDNIIYTIKTKGKAEQVNTSPEKPTTTTKKGTVEEKNEYTRSDGNKVKKISDSEVELTLTDGTKRTYVMKDNQVLTKGKGGITLPIPFNTFIK